MTNKEFNKMIIDAWVEGKVDYEYAFAMLQKEDDVVIDAIEFKILQ